MSAHRGRTATGPPERRYSTVMETDNQEAVRGFADAINRDDLDTALALCHPEIEFVSMLAVTGRAYIGHQGIREYFEDVRGAFDEWRVEVHGVAPAPDGRVAIAMTMHARGRESGAALSEPASHVWTVRDGRLRRNEHYREPEEALRAVGASAWQTRAPSKEKTRP
jgi:ketosteroid isomerase-like protein